MLSSSVVLKTIDDEVVISETHPDQDDEKENDQTSPSLLENRDKDHHINDDKMLHVHHNMVVIKDNIKDEVDDINDEVDDINDEIDEVRDIIITKKQHYPKDKQQLPIRLAKK